MVCFALVRFTPVAVFKLGNFRFLTWRTCGLMPRGAVMLPAFSPGLALRNSAGTWCHREVVQGAQQEAERENIPLLSRLGWTGTMSFDRSPSCCKTAPLALDMLEAPSKNVMGCQNFLVLLPMQSLSHPKNAGREFLNPHLYWNHTADSVLTARRGKEEQHSAL